jgi:hypothetical protein
MWHKKDAYEEYLVGDPSLSVCQQCFRDRIVAVWPVLPSDRHGGVPHSRLCCSCLEQSLMGPAGWKKR